MTKFSNLALNRIDSNNSIVRVACNQPVPVSVRRKKQNKRKQRESNTPAEYKPSRKRIEPKRRLAVVLMKVLKKPIKLIQQTTGVSVSSIRRIWLRYLETEDIAFKTIPGRKKKITDAEIQVRIIIQYIIYNIQ